MEAAVASRLARAGGILQRERVFVAHRDVRDSVLADRLVDLWSWGAISTPILQWLAAGAVQDLRLPSADFANVDKLAAIGAHGAFANNTRRDLVRIVGPRVELPFPCHGSDTIRQPQGRQSVGGLHGCFHQHDE